MSEQTSSIISKVWGMCGPLRDDGVSYGDYLEQLTYLIFLKMSDEYSRPPYRKQTGIPEGYGWTDMNTLTGADLEEQYKRRWKSWASRAVSSVRSSRVRSTRSAMPRSFTGSCR